MSLSCPARQNPEYLFPYNLRLYYYRFVLYKSYLILQYVTLRYIPDLKIIVRVIVHSILVF